MPYHPPNEIMMEQQCLVYALLVKHLSLSETMEVLGEAVKLAASLRDGQGEPAVPALWNLATELTHSNCLTDGCGHTIHAVPLPLLDRR